jgi:hypothetical protein
METPAHNLTRLTLRRFRSFQELRLDGLAHVNLLVGSNNVGKSSVLEAVEILATRGSSHTLWALPVRRGEILFVAAASDTPSFRIDADVRHLFAGHRLEANASFSIESESPRSEVRCDIVETRELDPSMLRVADAGVAPLALKVRATDGASSARIALTPDLGLHQHFRTGNAPSTVRVLGNDQPLARLLSGQGADMWERVVLTTDEQRVVEALRIIEPTVERIAVVPRPNQAGFEFHAKLTGSDARVPLASMGDGMKRLFALALTIVTSAGRYVLIDDIDTGLHHTVMEKMWRLVIETACRLGAQVFATTHSLDCVTALASLIRRTPELGDAVAAHRLERGIDQAIRFGAEDLLVAARHEMDLR